MCRYLKQSDRFSGLGYVTKSVHYGGQTKSSTTPRLHEYRANPPPGLPLSGGISFVDNPTYAACGSYFKDWA